MNEPTFDEPLTPLQKAEYAARCFAEQNYRDCNVWSVAIRKTYGVRSLFRDLKSDMAQAIMAEKGEEQIRETIHITHDGGFTQFTPQEAYLIAQFLRSGSLPQ